VSDNVSGNRKSAPLTLVSGRSGNGRGIGVIVGEPRVDDEVCVSLTDRAEKPVEQSVFVEAFGEFLTLCIRLGRHTRTNQHRAFLTRSMGTQKRTTVAHTRSSLRITGRW
jgi:hypothetical protein